MPKRTQYAFGVLWVVSAVGTVGLFAAAPLSNPLTPIPAVITLVLALSVADAVRRALRDDPGERGGQTQLSEYTDEGNT